MLKVQGHKLPTHLCVGVRKSGTSWIWRQLQDHPQISTPPDKEVYFFNDRFYLGLDWYKSQFQANKIVLDMTPDYFYAECGLRIKNNLPWAKIFVCLRNPIERAFSHFKFAKFINNLNQDATFLDAWNNDWKGIRTRGLYDKHLKAYQELFPEEKLLVCFYDDLKDEPVSFIKRIHEFLGSNYLPSKFENIKVMPGKEDCWKKIDPYEPRDQGYEKYNQKIFMSEEEHKILRQYYERSVGELSRITNRNLYSWVLT